MNVRVMILVGLLGCTAAAHAQQPPPCANIESLKLPEGSAKEMSEYARTVADSVSRSSSETSESPSQKQWSVLARAGISKDGQVSAVAITTTSGDVTTDQEVTDAIQRASPFPALPTSTKLDCIAVGLNFVHAHGQKVLVSTGGGVFRVGVGVSAPKAIFSPSPEYSEEARKAHHQGVCVLALIISADGEPRDIRVARSLGMGLDEKAIEAVKQWKFQPAMKEGKPVAVAVNIEVAFRL
jgi:TonB family protein